MKVTAAATTSNDLNPPQNLLETNLKDENIKSNENYNIDTIMSHEIVNGVD